MPDLTDMAARWTLEDTSEINCFAVWVESTLTQGVEMTTMLATSWEPLIYRVKPFAGKPLRLRGNPPEARPSPPPIG